MTNKISQLEIQSPKRVRRIQGGWEGFFPYYAGYSEQFAQGILKSAALYPGAVVLDPWNGSGTTTYASAQLQQVAIGFDLNPVMVVVARARLLPGSEADSLEPLAKELVKASRGYRSQNTNDPLLNWFDLTTTSILRSLERAVTNNLVGHLTLTKIGPNLEYLSTIAATFYVALFSVGNELGETHRSSNPTWTRRSGKDKKRVSATRAVVEQKFIDRLVRMAHALTSEQSKPLGRMPAQIRVADSTQPQLPNGSVDLVLTSPPYCTRIRDKTFEVIDGQQRLWSVWEFVDDKYPYQSDGKKRLFSELTDAQKRAIQDYTFQITMFQEADEDYLRELFVRLQLGLLLNTGEKLHAATGKMKQFVFGSLADHKFIKSLGIPERRFARQTLCAQICINSFTRQKLKAFARTRYDDLIAFFSEYSDPQGPDLALFRGKTKSIPQVLDKLWDTFSSETQELKNRSYILSIYLFVEENDLSASEQKLFANFVFQLWKRLREEAKLGMDRKNRELYSFQSMLSSAPGEVYQIEGRHAKLGEYFDYFKSKKKIKGD